MSNALASQKRLKQKAGNMNSNGRQIEASSNISDKRMFEAHDILNSNSRLDEGRNSKVSSF